MRISLKFYLVFVLFFLNTLSAGFASTAQVLDHERTKVQTGYQLRHQYTFEDGTAKDLVGNADGILNGGSIENGIYTAQTNGDHIELPAQSIAINTFEAVTLEACVTVSQGLNQGFTMLSYFGNSYNNVGSNGYFISLARGDDHSRTAITCGNEVEPYNAETGINGPELEDGQKHHIVSILDKESISLYIDGQLIGSTPLAAHNLIDSLSNNLAFLCKGGYVNDPSWLGSLHEFNIYDTALPINSIRNKSVAFLGLDGQPVAKAGQNVFVKPGELVTLNASASYDPMGKTITYKWTAPEGIVLSSDETVNPSFVAPEFTNNTELLFSLVVNNGSENSEPDEIIVKVCLLPELSTYSVSNITKNTAITGGAIAFEGKSAVTAKGVCWSTDPQPDILDDHDNQGAGAGNFSSLISGLKAETTYYVRAYASNQEGTAYSNELIFDTYGSTPWDNLSSHLPIIKIDTYGNAIINEPKITANMKVINQSGRENNVNDTLYEYDGYIGIELRGNTSQWIYEKKSFGLETRLEDGENNNVELLGLPKENDWVLYAPSSDKTMLRNVIAYHLGNTMGNWSPRTRFCEVFINNEYRGVYVLTEKIKIDNDRVDIATLKPEENEDDQLTGGYIMRIDRHREGSWISPFKGWTGTSDVPISYYDPKYDELTEAQKQYIKDYVTDFETALAGEQFKDTTEGYRPYIDLVSFIDYMIMTELSRNLDGYRCSVYFHKDKDSKGGKLNMSPFWDYNLCFGNGNFMQAYNPVGWVVEGIGSGDGYEPVFWYEKLRQDPYYETWFKYRWNELRNTSFNEEYIYSFIDSCTTHLGAAIDRNYTKFDILNQQIWPNYYVGGNYENEINYLKGWFEQRFDWLDEQIAQIVPAFDIENGIASARYTAQVQAYPNPFTENITFSLSLPEKAGLTLIIRDLTGKTVYSQSALYSPGSHKIVVSANNMPQNNSLFIYSLMLEGKIIKTGKLIRK